MVFITGYSGRFPASDSFPHFWSNLCKGVDLVTECPARYPPGYFGLPGRQAQCQGADKFDAMFFGISSAQAEALDPQIRLLLEVVFETITDAGYTMEELAKSNTGVYVGGCFSDLHKALLRDIRTINGYENTGCSHSMFANRISFCFDFTGPSLTIDTACSSSLVALDMAARDIRSGKVDRAVVAGVSIATDPGERGQHLFVLLLLPVTCLFTHHAFLYCPYFSSFLPCTCPASQLLPKAFHRTVCSPLMASAIPSTIAPTGMCAQMA